VLDHSSSATTVTASTTSASSSSSSSSSSSTLAGGGGGGSDPAIAWLTPLKEQIALANELATTVSTKMVGYLVKQGAVRRNWKRRWCVLTQFKLRYYKSKDDMRPAGEIPLTGVLVHTVADNTGSALDHTTTTTASTSDRDRDRDRDHSGATAGGGDDGGELSLVESSVSVSSSSASVLTPTERAHRFLIETSSRTYSLCAESEAERLQWIAALSESARLSTMVVSPSSSASSPLSTSSSTSTSTSSYVLLPSS